jgi:chaperonin GroEL
MEEGYVSGGGVALLNSIIEDAKTDGEKILNNACLAPIIQILKNAGIEVLLDDLKVGEGYDVISGEKVDMVKFGIIDPLKVVRQSMINAVSVAGLLATTEYVITDEQENDVQTLRRIFTRKD